jgi:hypothetical protein
VTATSAVAAPPAHVDPALPSTSAAAPGASAGAAARAPTPRPAAASKPTPNEVLLTQRVLADLQRQVELMLEVRLREALAPILARASDALVRDARKELTAAMRDIVARSIARELGRREDR